MLDSICQVMREAYKRGWISTRDGNISVRDGVYLYITPSSVRKYEIEPYDLIKIGPQDLLYHERKAKASIELDMHLNVHAAMKKSGSVVHLHPTYTIAALHKGFDLAEMTKDFPELSRYTKVGKQVPFLTPGSKELAQMTAKSLKNSDLVPQVGHGVTAKGKTPWEAFEHIERLEHICEIVLASGVGPDGRNSIK